MRMREELLGCEGKNKFISVVLLQFVSCRPSLAVSHFSIVSVGAGNLRYHLNAGSGIAMVP